MTTSYFIKFGLSAVVFIFAFAAFLFLATSRVEARGWGWVTPIREAGYFGCGANSEIYGKTINYTTLNTGVNAGQITVRIRNIANGAVVATLTGNTTTNSYNCFNRFTQYFEVTVAGGNGWKGLYMYATDVAANHSNAIIAIRIYVVPTTQTHSIDAYSPVGGWFSTNNVTLGANVTTLSPTYGATCSRAILWYWDGGFRNEQATACTTGNFAKTFWFADGVHSWTAQSRDNACMPGCFGKLSGLGSDANNAGWNTFYVDTQAPFTVSASHAPASPTNVQDVTISANAQDSYSGVDSIQIYVDGVQKGAACTWGGFFGPGNANCPRNVGTYSVGNHTYRAYACDKAGNCAWSPTYSFAVKEAADLEVDAIGSYGEKHVGDTFTVTVTVRNNSNDTNAGAFLLQFCRNGNGVTYTCNVGWVAANPPIGGLAKGGVVSRDFSVTAPDPGVYPFTYTMLARADLPGGVGPGAVPETIEVNNNRKKGDYTVIGPPPWFQTRGGDVGSFLRIDPDDPPPKKLGVHSAEYLVISDSMINSTTFTSAKQWLVQNYNGINIWVKDETVSKGESIYDALFKEYKVDTSNTIVGSNLNNIPATSNNRIFYVNGALSIPGGGVNYPNNKDPAVVFVDGQMVINGNLSIGSNTGLVFVVSRYVDVKNGVSQADGVYIFDEDYYARSKNNSSENKLTVNGAVIGGFTKGGFHLDRDFRSGKNKNEPTELFVFEPKYLWLFREIIGEAETILKEVAP